MIGGQFGVDALVELAVAGVACVERLVAAVVLRELLLDDVGLDRDAEVVGLAGEIGGEMVILVLLEGVVAEVAPEDGCHAEFMGMVEGFGHLDDLVAGIIAAEVDGGTDGGRTHVVGLIDRAEHDLAGDVRIGEELVVVHLHEEGDLVGVFAGHGTEDAEGGGDGVATALDGQFHDVLGIEVDRVLGKAGSRAVLDSLIDGKDREVAGVGQAAGAVHALEVGENARIAVASEMDAVDEIGPGKVQEVLGDGLAGVVEEGVGVGSEEVLDVVDHGLSSSKEKKRGVQNICSGRP